jgi:hypothetical protein
MAKANASQKKTGPTDLCTNSTPGPNLEVEDHDSHTELQQPFRFIDLPPELRDRIYTFALYPEMRKTHFGECLKKPNLLAGLANSTTARALSQTCRTVRRESMKAYYSKNTFEVRGVPDPWGNFDPMPGNNYTHPRAPKPGCPPPPDPLRLWARTWGVLGAQHIRSLEIDPLGGLVHICMTGEADPVSAVETAALTWLSLSVPEVHAAALKVFGTSSFEGQAAAGKLNEFFCEIGIALRAARNRYCREYHVRKRLS